MAAPELLKIRWARPGAGPRTASLHAATLVRELVDHDRLPPDAEVWDGGAWVALRDHPNPVWLAPMAERAVRAAEELDPRTMERYAEKILHFHPRPENGHTRLAHFLQGHALLCEGRCREAVGKFQIASASRSRFQAASANNLAVAWARVEHAEAALAALEEAIRIDATAAVPRLNMRNLTTALADEGAHDLSGRPTWAALAARAAEALGRIPEAAVRAQLAARDFPAVGLWHVFQPGASLVGIGNRLPPRTDGEAAARHLLQAAHRAFAAGDHERALVLARTAPTFDARERGEAEYLAAAAGVKVESALASERAGDLIQRLDRFLHDVRSLSLSNLHGAQESLMMLKPLLGDPVLNDLYRRRVERLALSASADVAPDERDLLLSIASHYSSPPDADAYHRAAGACLTHRAMALFAEAVTGGDLPAAAEALALATRTVGPEADYIRDAQKLLRLCTEHRAPTEPSDSATSPAVGG